MSDGATHLRQTEICSPQASVLGLGWTAKRTLNLRMWFAQDSDFALAQLVVVDSAVVQDMAVDSVP